jgi:alanyl-tRNA synthetase
VRQGVRVEFVCGERALRAARRDHQVLAEAAAILSAHPWEVPRQLQLSIDEARQQRKRGEQWMEEAAAMHAAELLSEADASTPRIVAKMLTERELTYAKQVAQKIARSEGPAVALLACSLPAPALVFAQTPGAGFDMQALLKEIVGAYGGRGGGTRDLAQGGVPSVQGLQEALHALATRLRSQIVPAAS